MIHENILILQFQTFSQEELDELENYIIDEDKNRKHTFSEVNGFSKKYRGFNFKSTVMTLIRAALKLEPPLNKGRTELQGLLNKSRPQIRAALKLEPIIKYKIRQNANNQSLFVLKWPFLAKQE